MKFVIGTLWGMFCIALVVFAYSACSDGSKDGYNSAAYKDDRPAPATTAESSYRMSGINHYQGKHQSGYFYFGDSDVKDQAILDAVAAGIKRTNTVLAQEYPDQASKIVKTDGYGVVFWKPSPLCTSAPAFTISYIGIVGSGDTVYDNGEYDKDPRKGRITICAAGKSRLHTWLQNKPQAIPGDTLHVIDLVEDPAMSGEAAKHEALHLGLFDVDPGRYEATKYHGGDWETILNKVLGGAVGFADRGQPRSAASRIKIKTDDGEEEFSAIVVK